MAGSRAERMGNKATQKRSFEALKALLEQRLVSTEEIAKKHLERKRRSELQRLVYLIQREME
jgi:hypothetical protein